MRRAKTARLTARDERLKKDAMNVVQRASAQIPAAVWYGVTPQLVSHAAHPNSMLANGVAQLLDRKQLLVPVERLEFAHICAISV